MKNQNLNSATIEDERIEFLINAHAAKAFVFLVYYLGISILIKSFVLDVNIFVYWDNAIALVVAGVYMIYRSSNEGVPVAPSSVNVLDSAQIKVNGVVSVLFGVFVTFIVSGLDDRMKAFFPSVTEKLAGAVIIGIFFFLLMTGVFWLIDILPTKRAFRKAAELTGEPGDANPTSEEIIKQSSIKDERIDRTIEKYAVHALYFVLAYITGSTFLKFFVWEISLIYYADAFVASVAAAGYLTYFILKSRV